MSIRSKEHLVLHKQGLKTCNKCEEIKPLDAFHNRKAGILGKHAHCKVCTSAYNKKYYAEHRKERDSYFSEYYYSKRKEDMSIKYRENEEVFKRREKIRNHSPIKNKGTATRIIDKNPYYEPFMVKGVLNVKCYFCTKHFVPKYLTVSKFLSAEDGYKNMYCSDKCKQDCSSYNQRFDVIHPDSIQYIEPDAKQKARACQSNQLKQLQVDEYGYNFCEKCSKEVEIVELHHTLPVAEYGQEAINSASHILLCVECHKELTKECRKNG